MKPMEPMVKPKSQNMKIARPLDTMVDLLAFRGALASLSWNFGKAVFVVHVIPIEIK
jgi:hypothetical protein